MLIYLLQFGDIKDKKRLNAWKYILVKQPINYDSIVKRYDQEL